MLNCDDPDVFENYDYKVIPGGCRTTDPDVFENYDYKVIPGGCRTTDPDSGESEDMLCVNCHGGHPGYCEWYPKAKAKATALLLKKAMVGLKYQLR